MNRKFWLTDVRVHMSPGFDSGTFPPVEELGEHLNVIWGPNGVGKSTLTRAMRSLIWNGRAHRDVEARGTLQSPGSAWDLSLANGKLRQTRLSDNQEIMLPGRNDELSESYWFTLHELLQEDAGHAETFVREVHKRMQGGVDLALACEDAGGISSFSRATVSQAKDAKDAVDHLKEVISEQERHQHIQDDIERLHHEVEQGPALDRRKAVLLSAQFLLKTHQEIGAIKEQLASYDPAILSVRADSPQRKEELETSLQKAQEALDELLRQEQELTIAFNACLVQDQQLEDGEKPLRLKHRVAEYEGATSALKTCNDAFAQAEASLQEWEREHSWLMGDPPEQATLQAHVATLKRLASECEPLRCSLDANRRLEEALGEYEDLGHSSKELSRLLLRLSDWITLSWRVLGTQEGKPLKGGTKKRVLFSAALAGILASLLGMAIHPAVFIAGSLAMLALVALLLPSAKQSPDFGQITKELQEKQEELNRMFATMGMQGPSSWTTGSCQTLMVALGEQLAVIQQGELLNQRRRRAKESHAASEEKLRLWTEAWQEAALAIGLHPDQARLEGAQFFHFAQRLDTWSAYRVAYESKRTVLLEAQEERERALLALQRELQTEERDSVSLKAMSETLVKRLERAASLQGERKDISCKILSAQKELDAWSEELKEFWQQCGLAFGQEEKLRRLASQVEPWKDLQRSLRHKEVLYDERSEETPEALSLVHTHSQDDLQEEILQVEKEQGLLRAKLENLGRLRQLYDALKFGSVLSEAELAKAKTQEALQALREEQVMGRMITTLVSDLQAESEKEFQPQVLKHASEWLATITNNRYTISANKEGFFATDAIMAKNYKLDALSSGTRIQLLFSIRMAFITMQEETSGVSLPIFLDELLANSDDDRAAAIVRSIGEIAKNRQVFYVTAQRDEVEKLSTIGSDLIKVIPLEDLGRDHRVSKVPLKPYVYEKRVIPPPLEDYHAYAKSLTVAGPGLWEPLEGLHSWHLCTDSQQLYGYLKQGLSHVGQLLQALGPEHSLSFRLNVLRRAQMLAEEGRCRPLDASSLEGAPASLNRGTNYWSQMVEKVGEGTVTGNDLLRLIRDKEIKNLSASNLETLSDWLMEHGYATEKEPKGAEEIISALYVIFDKFSPGSDDEEVIHRWLVASIGE